MPVEICDQQLLSCTNYMATLLMILALLLCSDQAIAAAARLATSPPIGSFSHPLPKAEWYGSLVPVIFKAAAGSLVAAALLRCLLHDGVSRRLGGSAAYRFASSVQQALGPGQQSLFQITDVGSAKFSGPASPALQPWLAEVLGTHLAAVDRGCQLLLQHAGSQLQQVLQRTVCQPMKIHIFWRGAVSKKSWLWSALTSFLCQVLLGGLDQSALMRWDASPQNAACWKDLQELTDTRLRHILSSHNSSWAGSWGKQWGCVVAAVSASAQRLFEVSLRKDFHILRQLGSAASWPLNGRCNTLVLLSAGTLHLLRLLQSQQGGTASSGSRRDLCRALGDSGVALLSVARLCLTQDRPSARQVQSCMEATTLGLAALRPMVDVVAEGEAAGSEAVKWLTTAAVPALQRIKGCKNNGDLLWEPDRTADNPSSELQAPDLPVAAAEAAEAALRLSAAFLRLAPQLQSVPGALLVAASVVNYCSDLAKQLLDAHQLALVVADVAASLPPGSISQGFRAFMPETGAVLNMYQSVMVAVSSQGPRTDHL
ncbi:hypothetical protein N2152v2_002559 [Parachlorella kessleri]